MTKRNIIIERKLQVPVEEQRVELVERKGIGHPDSIADGIADSVSRALCREYEERFGGFMHHNTDQVEIVGGSSAPTFGGGEVLRPIYILVTGRATTEVGEEHVPVSRIGIEAAKSHIRESIRNLDVERYVVIESKIGQGSADLMDIFKREGMPRANDTSFGVSHAPLSETESLTLESEHLMNSEKFKDKYPESGEDIKVMGLREGDKITLTIADAMVSKYIDDMDHYRSVKEDMISEINDLASNITKRDVEVQINTGDDYERGSVYLTVTGTSAESGDDGSVGRGNRVNGLITPNRFMSMEAAAGKNPVNHVGKLYNLLAVKIANDIVQVVDDCQEVYVWLLSQIGKPIDQPKAASVQLIANKKCNFSKARAKCESVVDQWLEDIQEITEMFIKGELKTF